MNVFYYFRQRTLGTPNYGTLACYNCYNMTYIYVYIRLRLIKEINHDRPVFNNVANTGALKTLWEKLPGCG